MQLSSEVGQTDAIKMSTANCSAQHYARLKTIFYVMLGFEEHFKEVTHEHARNLMAEIAHVETTDATSAGHTLQPGRRLDVVVPRCQNVLGASIGSGSGSILHQWPERRRSLLGSAHEQNRTYQSEVLAADRHTGHRILKSTSSLITGILVTRMWPRRLTVAARWQKNATVFPHHMKLARTYLAIPVSSVQSEWLF